MAPILILSIVINLSFQLNALKSHIYKSAVYIIYIYRIYSKTAGAFIRIAPEITGGEGPY